jgi:hypothetical protein
MRRLAVLGTAGLVGLLVAGIGRPAAAQEERQLFISLLDASGLPVTDLRRDEVTVLEDGVEREILRLEAIDWPMKLTVLVDNGPVSGNALVHLRNGLHSLFEELPAGVEISLLTTAPQPRWIVRPTRDHQKVIGGISLVAPDSGAPKFLEALIEAAERISRDDSNYFPVTLIIGSDGPEGSLIVERDINRMAERMAMRATTVHVIMIGLGGRRSLNTTGANQVEVGIQLARMTGGRYESIAASTRLATLLPEIGAQIAQSHLRQSQQYRITYDASSVVRPNSARPVGIQPDPQITARTTRPGVSGILTSDGHIP